MPNLVGAGPMRANPGQRVAPHSLAGEASARMPVDAGEPYPPISGRPQDGIGASLLAAPWSEPAPDGVMVITYRAKLSLT